MTYSGKKELLFALTPPNESRLNDANMMDVVRLLRNQRQTPVIDPLWTRELMANNNEEKRQQYTRLIDGILCKVTSESPSPLVLLPLFDDEHWSLLVLVFGIEEWQYFHLDSEKGFHEDYMLLFITRLGRYSSVLTQDPVFFIIPKAAPQQKYDWECGHFVLMYMSMLMKLVASYSAEFSVMLRRHLSRNISSCCYRNIKSFSEEMKSLIQ